MRNRGSNRKSTNPLSTTMEIWYLSFHRTIMSKKNQNAIKRKALKI